MSAINRYLQTLDGLRFVARNGRQRAAKILQLAFKLTEEQAQRCLLSCDIWRMYD